MFFRKLPLIPSPPWTSADKQKHSKTKETHFQFSYSFALFAFLISLWLLLLLFFWFPHTNTAISPGEAQYFTPPNTAISSARETQYYTDRDKNDYQNPKTRKSLAGSTCDRGLSVYVYELPEKFNVGLLQDCRHLNVYTDMCPHVANSGLGQPIPDMGLRLGLDSTSWFATHQFIAEMIFHVRVANHPCRTWDPSRANLFYVPFYGGLHASSMFREANHTTRDALAVDLVDFLINQPTWKNHNGKNHVLALGRTAWDFMRTHQGADFGANCLLNLPPVQNMSVLTVEKHPWEGGFYQHGIPYPSYFHPSTWQEMLTWQNMMRSSSRPHLFSFVGATRKGVQKAEMRVEIVKQCLKPNSKCHLLQCTKNASKCYDPREVLQVMARSEFCLQVPGDSFTRRSTFDSILTGCIPVFFSPHTAYSQYSLFLPEDPTEYSVYIDGEKGEGRRDIEAELLKIPRETVERMRRKVVDLIPRVTYANPNSSDFGFKDAVDVALEALAKHVGSQLLNETVDI